MTTAIANLFPIENAADLTIPYRLWQVSGLINTGDLDRNLNLAAKRVGFETRQPVAVVRRGGDYALALPKEAEPPPQLSLTPSVVQLAASDEGVARLAGGDEAERAVGEEFLRFALRGALMRDKGLWGSPTTSFSTSPCHTSGGIDMYAGFRWSVVYYRGEPYVCIDPTFRYHDAAPPTTSPKRMAHALYAKGRDYYDIQILAVSDLTVAEARFKTADGESWSVLSYGRRFNSDVPLDPEGRAIVYRYPGRTSQQLHGALELVRLRRHTDGIEETGLHRRSILAPDERLVRSRGFVRHFCGVVLGEAAVEVASTPTGVPSASLPLPRLRYHDGFVLDPNAERVGYPRSRRRRLYESASKHELSLDTQFVLVPRKSISRQVGDAFCAAVEHTLRALTGSKHLRVERVVYEEPSGSSTQSHLDAIAAALGRTQLGSGAALLILPRHAPDDLHNAVKAELSDWRFQCIEARTVLRQTNPGARERGAGVLEHTCLGLLLANRLYAFSLEDAPVGDVHIGVDVKGEIAAFVFVADRGRKIAIETFPVSAGERLHTAAVRKATVKGLRAVLARLELRSPHVVYHRDGRTFVNEIDGLRGALNALVDEGLVTPESRISIVEILKSAGAPLRLYRVDNKPALLGDFLVLDERTGVVVLTGRPFATGGTPNPLMIHVRSGEYAIADALRDVLALAQLAFQAPGAPLGLPATVKLADDLVAELGGDYDVDAARYGADDDANERVPVGERCG